MKKALTTLLLAGSLSLSTAQNYEQIPNMPKQEKKEISNFRKVLPYGLLFVSGAFDGTAEALRYHYDGFKEIFPNCSDRFWNPSNSWRNKYKNGDPAQGQAYPFSRSALVWTTDGFHMMRMGRNVTAMASVTLKIGEKKNWKEYVLEMIGSYASYTLGFKFTYDYMFQPPQD